MEVINKTVKYILFYGIVIVVGVINLVQDNVKPIVAVLSSALVVYGIMQISDYFLYDKKMEV